MALEEREKGGRGAAARARVKSDSVESLPPPPPSFSLLSFDLKTIFLAIPTVKNPNPDFQVLLLADSPL